MLSIIKPELLAVIQQIPGGLLPIYDTELEKYFLVIKASKETILTAKINNEFKIYLTYDQEAPGICLGIISAFFDDSDEPLTITTPLFSGDSLVDDLRAL